jgi:hypothetical protein
MDPPKWRMITSLSYVSLMITQSRRECSTAVPKAYVEKKRNEGKGMKGEERGKGWVE